MLSDALAKGAQAKGAGGAAAVPDVMAPGEAATYLKVSEEDVVAAISANQLKATFETLTNPNQHVVKAWDNRIGCALAVDLLSELRGVDHPNTVYGVATVQEEIGLRGAATSAS